MPALMVSHCGAYRHDDLLQRYQRTRCDHASQARRISRAKRARAAQIAAAIVAAHGNTLNVEHCRISTRARLWGTRIALFSPGMLVSALETECVASAGRFYRADTASTALSQHRLCGQRVAKTLDKRTHHCGRCGLRADRDIVSAALAACVELTDPDEPRTVRVDYRLAHALRAGLAPQQEWGGLVNRHQPPAPPMVPDRPGPAATTRWPLLNTRHSAHPRNRPNPTSGRRGTSRKQPAPKLIGAA